MVMMQQAGTSRSLSASLMFSNSTATIPEFCCGDNLFIAIQAPLHPNPAHPDTKAFPGQDPGHSVSVCARAFQSVRVYLGGFDCIWVCV